MLKSLNFLQRIIPQYAQTASTVVPSEHVIHRVKILNLPPHEMGSIKKLLQRLDLNQRYKKAPKWDYAYLNFETEEAAKAAIDKLKGVEFKKRLLTTEYIKVDQKVLHARFEAKKKVQEEKAIVEADTRLPAERLADQVTPLYKIPYSEQVAKKHKLGHRFLNTLRKKLNTLPELSEAGRAQIAWTNNQKNVDYTVEDIIQSPLINGYRTKCEFTIGKDLTGEKTVGFLLGLYREGCTAVLDPEQCLHVSDTAKQIAKAMEDYVKDSKYDVYDRIAKTGVWRSIMTKTQKTGDNMILIQMKAFELTGDQLEQERQSLVAYWSRLKEEGKINTTTLLLQIWNGDSNCITDKGETEVLIGDGYVHEEILGCRFRVSNNAFFQVNTPTTELLYAKCAEWCNFNQNKKTTLLDLCCGTGTIGIIMARSVDRVISIEMVPEAIVDAKANAFINGITNIQHYTGKVEENIDIITNENNEQVLAILDPPRSGVHSSVIRAVRESEKIQKVIFISCDAKQAMQNFIGLCRPTSNRFKGLPFKPSRAISIDLFPHTNHSELMIEFTRIDKEIN
ncbi:tRNA (uracil-5-)-methyltransferase A [Choanephora cucurbitarum]|uniref:tRNA (Uracil-5-)-methyltransferase A n=1 Tax=Choanephora cucurbitarum TaxID=101091 RepID=A0A1C7NB52_9FUNG|nr:tRNA (uracil-5-)-methyltransferase A [Choanephora cucurbitarum]